MKLVIQISVVFLTMLCSVIASAKTERVKSTELIADNTSEDSVKTVMEAMRVIKEEYVAQVKERDLVEAAVNGMLSSLDPHSAYYNKEASKEMELHTAGELEGIGIDVTGENGLLKIVSPIDGSPAEKAGIMPGDYIFAIDNENVYGLSSHDVVQKIRGKPNTSVKISVLREGITTPLEFNLVRDKVRLTSIKTQVLDDYILYFRISYFYGNTARLLEEALRKHVTSKKVKGIILDLRNNPGGLLDQAVKVASIFVNEGDIVYTKGRNQENAVTYSVDKKVLKVKNIPIAVLINNGTASAAEIVASSLQDHKKAIILGVRSFGKGSVQEVISIDNGGTMALTTALYYTPSGRSIQLDGVTPDIIVEDVDVKKARENSVFREEDIHGRLAHGQNIKHKESIMEKLGQRFPKPQHRRNAYGSYSEDYMTIRAVDLIKGINIYSTEKAKK